MINLEDGDFRYYCDTYIGKSNCFAVNFPMKRLNNEIKKLF